MLSKVLAKGNEAIAEGAIRAGCQAYFGYPITPQTELLEYMARRMPELGRVFVQAESEVAAISMVFGAAAAGARVMTSSSSPGISLKQEGISYLAANNLPAVIVNVMRGGPGLGNIAPAQADYFQATKGGGHGDYHSIVLAPSSVQEAMDLTSEAFDLADHYRVPVMVLTDGYIGQMMEPVSRREWQPHPEPKPWALSGAKDRPRNLFRSIFLEVEKLENVNLELQRKYRRIEQEQVRYFVEGLDDADLALVAYGTSARVARTAMRWARQEGLRVGLFRPVSLYPFPYAAIASLAGQVKAFLCVEMNAGQMIEDVRLASAGRAPAYLSNRLGGIVVSPEEVLAAIKRVYSGQEPAYGERDEKGGQ